MISGLNTLYPYSVGSVVFVAVNVVDKMRTSFSLYSNERLEKEEDDWKISRKKLEKKLLALGWTLWNNGGVRLNWYKQNNYWLYVAEYDLRRKCVYFRREW